MELSDNQRHNKPFKAFDSLCFALPGMGNGIETECLRFHAEIGISAISHSKTETDRDF